ncbi:hypothetical protein GCM10027169_25170 [Gordonia jinhuaensis]|uniref:CAS/CSE protein involved in chromosome segregation n=1 Tax=Gordonia jinhuaensis TaxID=1517702 RepID=A0A916TBP1_9ACTN|nr:hypothetical protein [Gordonia jinhuaensis]GGB39336.1 hypothetical protein GCM10011489_28770 [Gordonia jinhuaensis]
MTVTADVFNGLYVLDVAHHAILQVSLPDGKVDILTDDAGPSPDGIVVAPDRLYWTTMGRPHRAAVTTTNGEGWDYTDRNGSIRTARRDGSEVTELVPEGSFTTGKQLAADLDARLLYFCDREGAAVYRVGTDGSDLTALIRNQRDDTWTQECVGVAVDPGRLSNSSGGYLYWTQKGPSKGGRGRILRAGLDIPERQSAETRTDIETLFTDLPEPIDLHVEPEAGLLFWTDRGAPPAGNTLNVAPIPASGEHGSTPTVLADGFDEAIGLAVDTEGGYVYVSDLGGTIRAVPLADGADEHVVARVDGAKFTGIAGY